MAVTTPTSPAQTRGRRRVLPAFGAVRWLVGGYLILSMLTVAAIIALSGIAPDLVSPQAWVRGIIVATTSVLTFIFASRAATGNQRALLRLRIAVAVILIAVVAVLFFLPLPLWMIIEQAACGALLLATAIIIFGGRRRRADKNAPSSEQESRAAS